MMARDNNIEVSIAPKPLNPWLIAAFLASVVFFLYRNCFRFQFVTFDDPLYVTDNPFVLGGLTRENLWWAFTNTHGFYHPLTWISLMIDAGFHAGPGPFHLTNLWLHSINTVLVFYLLKHASIPMFLSVCGALTFACHPANVESVCWISERKGLLSFAFTLSSLLLYLRANRLNTLRLIGALCLFGLGLLSKPSAITIPLIMLCWDLLLRRMPLRQALKWTAPFFFLALVFGIIAIVAERNANAIHNTSVAFSIARILANLGWYLFAFSGTIQYAPYYPLGDVNPWNVLVSIFSLSLLSIFAIRRGGLTLFGWCWFMFSLLPIIGFLQIGLHATADRYLYLPSVGLLVFTSSAVAEFSRSASNRSIPEIVSLAVIAFVFFLVIKSSKQIPVWRDSIALFERAFDVSGPSNLVCANLGVALQVRGEDGRAANFYRMGIACDRRSPECLSNLGVIFSRHLNDEKAQKLFLACLEQSPSYAPALNNLAVSIERTQIYQFRTNLLPALKYAVSACEASQFKRLDYIDTALRCMKKADDFSESRRILALAINQALFQGNAKKVLEYRKALTEMQADPL